MSGHAGAIGAVSSGFSLIFCIIFLIVYFSVNTKPPALVCTYILESKSEYNVTPTGVKHYSNSTWYSTNTDENKILFYTQEEGMWYKLFYVNDLYYSINPLFNRTSCTKMQFSGTCLTMYSGCSKQKWKYPCPSDPNKACDVYSWESKSGGSNETWYLFDEDDDNCTKGRVPSGMYSRSAYGESKTTFTKILPQVEPPSTVFDVPVDDAHCFDFDDYANKKRNEDGNNNNEEIKKALDGRFTINMISGERVFNSKANELINPIPAAKALKPQGGEHWTAKKYPQFDGMTYKQMANKLLWNSVLNRLGDIPSVKVSVRTKPSKTARDINSLPESFDATEKWSTCKTVTSIRDQGNCGSCWAFGTVEAFADRRCVANGADLELSPQHVMDCYGIQGCGGGYSDVAWSKLITNGTISETCYKYNEIAQLCPTKCDDKLTTPTYYKAKSAYTLYADGVAANTAVLMQQDLYTHGPMTVSFYVYEDFYDYESGVYQHGRSSSLSGAHAVKLVGWGVDNGVEYWKIANSWGSSWGEKGYFRIRRGVNECAIEETAVAGLV